MRTIRARRVCRDEIRKLFTQIGLIEGISVADAELDKIEKPMFWHGVVRNPKARNKMTYVSYYFPEYQEKYSADNDDFLREIMAAIDVFSKRSFDTKENLDLLESIENIFKDNGFEVEFADEIFEDETALFHYPLTIYKIY